MRPAASPVRNKQMATLQAIIFSPSTLIAGRDATGRLSRKITGEVGSDRP